MSNPKTLSILIARDGLSFSLSADGAVTHFHEKQFALPQPPENLLKEMASVLTYSFEETLPEVDEVKAFYAHPLTALVPRKVFDKEHLSDYLKYNVELLPTDELSYDQLQQMEANLVYVPYTNINNFLFEKFGEFTFHHLTSHFIDQCHKLSQTEQESVHINVFATHFDLCIFRNGQLLLSNSFEYYAPEDFAYYVLFAFEQLNVNREKLRLYLSGAMEKDAEIYELLYAYVRYVSFDERTPAVKLKTEALKQEEPHKHLFFLNTI